MIKEIWTLLRKEFMLEWKQRYAINGLLLYVLSMVVVISLALLDKLNSVTWNIIYWIIILFVAINAVAKSFMSEKPGHLRYLYGVAAPASIIIAKIIYNLLLLSVMSLLALGAFVFLTDQPIENPLQLMGMVVLGSFALASNLTLVTAIASKAENRNTLLAVLSFPLIVPTLLLLIRISRFPIEGLDADLSTDYVQLLGGMTVVMTALSVLLFPFVWRD
ncbi:heme exporter protein CcmB [Pontibacter sp. G13]|uniref:heme exporter protein CcmB n=1 Tax=Pontibacter sp. G13 TaxID=3074898 RepID=UPI00288BFF94|nr:heme exporter protein CcmB [Pontibacter sp. G13]WNJ20172.1 heme exporter protein CcmB [Pontibacter sp. G13]